MTRVLVRGRAAGGLFAAAVLRAPARPPARAVERRALSGRTHRLGALAQQVAAIAAEALGHARAAPRHGHAGAVRGAGVAVGVAVAAADRVVLRGAGLRRGL